MMSYIDDMKIWKKLMGGFFIVLLILVAVASLGYISLQEATARQNTVYGKMQGAERLALSNAAMEKMRGDIYRYIAVPADRTASSESLQTQIGLINDNMMEFRSRQLSAEEMASLDKFDEAWGRMQVTYKKLETDADANDKFALDAGLAAGSPAVTARTDCLAAVKALVAISFSDAGNLNRATNEATAFASMTLIIATILAVVAGLGIALYLSRSISGPVNQVKDNIREIHLGHFSERIKLNRKDEIGEMAGVMDKFTDDIQKYIVGTLKMMAIGDLSRNLKPRDERDEIVPAMKSVIETLRSLVTDTDLLAKAAEEGNLDTRADATKHQGDFRKIVEGINTTLDSVIGPLNVAAEYVDRISKGDIPAKITDKYNGDFNEIKNNLNNCIDGLQGLIECDDVLHSMALNDHTKKVEGEYVGVFATMARSTNDVRDRLLGVTRQINEIAVGDTKGLTDLKKIGKRSDQDQLLPAIIGCLETINFLIEDSALLTRAAVDGNLDTRADTSRHQGQYRTIIEGVNATLDSVIGPLNIAAEYVDRISKGDIPEKINATYNGDFNEIKNNLNNCIDNINALVTDANMLANAAIEGKLNTRADASKHQGEYKKIVQGFDGCLDAVIGPLNVAAKYVNQISKGDIPEKITATYNGDFNEIKNNLNNCIDNINALVDDANMLAKAAIEGKLNTRADASKHQGDYKKIVSGVNATLDSVIEPVNEAMRISEEYAHCNFNARVDEKLKVAGDFIRFKDALNSIGSSVQETIGLVNTQTTENAKCNFTARIDDSAHVQGDFVSIKNSLNNVTSEVSKAFISVNCQVAELAANAEEAAASTKEVSAGACTVATNVNNVSTAAEMGNEGIKEILRAIEDFSATVEEVTANTDSVANLARETNKITHDGAVLASQAEQGMVSITKSSAEVGAIIGDIKVQMNKIGEIVEIITNLANQTNLLALNAAIEAARAGDAGKGFAVVASEVKSLAQESRESAQNIGLMIGNLQEQSEKAAAAMVEANKEVRNGSEALTQTIDFFNKIVSSVDEITRSMEEVAKASDAQAKTVTEITKNVQTVSGIIQSTAKEATDAAAATEVTSVSIDQIASVIANVNKIVESVTRETSKFRV
jgi:methyl-accepting chemotaxis protein